MYQANQPEVVVQPVARPVAQPLMATPGSVGMQPNPSYKNVPALMGVSIVHIVMGILSTLLGIIAIILRCTYSYIGWGLWSGTLFFLVAGILGLIAATRKNNNNNCLVIAFMVMNIISAAAAFQLLVVAATATSSENSYYCYTGVPYHFDCTYTMAPRQAVDALLAITALTELVIAIVSASLSCYGICSCCRSYTPVTVHYMPQQAMTQFVPMMPVQGQQQQAQQQPQPVAMQGNQIGSQYVTDYRAPPPQQMANSPQQVTYPPQPVGPATQMVIAPQPVNMAPQQVVVSVPGQNAPVNTGRQAAETPPAYTNQASVTNTEEIQHFHHDDKEVLLETV